MTQVKRIRKASLTIQLNRSHWTFDLHFWSVVVGKKKSQRQREGKNQHKNTAKREEHQQEFRNVWVHRIVCPSALNWKQSGRAAWLSQAFTRHNKIGAPHAKKKLNTPKKKRKKKKNDWKKNHTRHTNRDYERNGPTIKIAKRAHLVKCILQIFLVNCIQKHFRSRFFLLRLQKYEKKASSIWRARIFSAVRWYFTLPAYIFIHIYRLNRLPILQSVRNVWERDRAYGKPKA